jgi:hypothetical protein
MSRKGAAPSHAQIKGPNVECEQGNLSARVAPENLAWRSLEIVFALFGFHFVSLLLKTLKAVPLLTTKQLQDSQIPFSGEETTLAALEEIGTFKVSTEVNSGVQRIVVMKFDLIARC